MNEIITLIIGILVLVMGYFIGELLARYTKEEIKTGRKYIKIVVLLGLIGGVVGLIFGNDFLLFGFFFMAIVAERSLKVEKKKRK
jgi:uncharacterized membrane protein YoaK (UPF0700 family)